MNEIHLAALRPSHPLAYLAALGGHRLIKLHADQSAKLAWAGAGTPAALLLTTLTKDHVLDALEEEWNAQAARGAPYLTECDGAKLCLPPKTHLMVEKKYKRDQNGDIKKSKRGEPQLLDGLADPSKLLPEEFALLAVALTDHQRQAWLRAIGTDVKIDEDTSLATVTRSRFYLLSRQQTLAQQFDSVLSPLKVDQREFPRRQSLKEAIDGWRRYEMTGGMNWDIGANQNAAETPIGDARMAVVPGAVWLALNALPLFPVSVKRGKACTRGWQETDDGLAFVMPVWRPPLDTAAIEVMLDHPLLGDIFSKKNDKLESVLTALGITAVYFTRVVERRVANQTERYLDVAKPVRAMSI